MNLYRPLGSTGLACHPLGFGCYRVADGNPTHAEALALYLERGGNLIDTSANYMDGAAEVLVGRVLREVAREKVIVVTKGGYIQGRNMQLAQERTFPEVVKYGEGIWHSIHPEFLETQVRLSAERMQVGYIDAYLLHNPEYFLDDISHRRPVQSADHDEFYRRVREAFRFLESQVAAGRIRWYGVSSNHYPLAASEATHTSVARTLAAAEEVSSNHHFRVVQLPLNLYESGGALEANNEGQTVLEFCQGKGIGVLANRPLNAFHGNRMIRLADFVAPGAKAPGEAELQALLAPLAAHEQKLATELGGKLMDSAGIAAALTDIVPQVKSAAHWEQAAGPYVIRPIQGWLGTCRREFAADPRWEQWQEQFLRIINEVFEGIECHVAAGHQAVSDDVRVRLAQSGYPASGESLSRLALNALLCLDGLSCALVGMRRPAYVEDAVGAAELPRVASREILARFA